MSLFQDLDQPSPDDPSDGGGVPETPEITESLASVFDDWKWNAAPPVEPTALLRLEQQIGRLAASVDLLRHEAKDSRVIETLARLQGELQAIRDQGIADREGTKMALRAIWLQTQELGSGVLVSTNLAQMEAGERATMLQDVDAINERMAALETELLERHTTLREGLAALESGAATLTESFFGSISPLDAVAESQGETKAALQAMAESQRETKSALRAMAAETQRETKAALRAIAESRAETKAALQAMSESQRETTAALQAIAAESQRETKAALRAIAESRAETKAALQAMSESQRETTAALQAMSESQRETKVALHSIAESRAETKAGLETLGRSHERMLAMLETTSRSQNQVLTDVEALSNTSKSALSEIVSVATQGFDKTEAAIRDQSVGLETGLQGLRSGVASSIQSLGSRLAEVERSQTGLLDRLVELGAGIAAAGSATLNERQELRSAVTMLADSFRHLRAEIRDSSGQKDNTIRQDVESFRGEALEAVSELGRRLGEQQRATKNEMQDGLNRGIRDPLRDAVTVLYKQMNEIESTVARTFEALRNADVTIRLKNADALLEPRYRSGQTLNVVELTQSAEPIEEPEK